jgi:hypothetical protein
VKGLTVILAVVVALLVAGLGSAVATTLITSAMIKDHTIKNVDLSADATKSLGQVWAVVNSDGTLARDRGATSAASLGVDGQYEVVFNRNVSACSYTATLGDATASTGAVGIATVAPREGNVKGVFVQTFDALTGTEANLPFHLAVFC